MKRITVLFGLAVTLGAIVALTSAGSGEAKDPPVYVTEVPEGYRDWKLISVAHEEGKLNDIRAILGNDIAIKAYREGTLPFPDGAIIARLAWSYIASEENNKTFGRQQSFSFFDDSSGIRLREWRVCRRRSRA